MRRVELLWIREVDLVYLYSDYYIDAREPASAQTDFFTVTRITCKAKALEYSREAAALGGTLKIHIKVDTGMSRLGYLCDGSHFDGGVEGICEACGLPGLEAEGIFTLDMPLDLSFSSLPLPGLR